MFKFKCNQQLKGELLRARDDQVCHTRLVYDKTKKDSCPGMPPKLPTDQHQFMLCVSAAAYKKDNIRRVPHLRIDHKTGSEIFKDPQTDKTHFRSEGHVPAAFVMANYK